MTKQEAVELQRLWLRAMEALSESLLVSRASSSGEEYDARKRATGSVIGRIQTDLLEPLYVHYPELDDLGDSNKSG
jgi:hypothetical protein